MIMMGWIRLNEIRALIISGKDIILLEDKLSKLGVDCNKCGKKFGFGYFDNTALENVFKVTVLCDDCSRKYIHE